MAKITFSNKSGRVRSLSVSDRPKTNRSVEDVVREIKKGQEKPPGEDYREKSLALHGLICARCSREFDSLNRRLLTVHHKDGNHHNNPPDGSNWENLCVYCHEDAHSRELLADHYGGKSGAAEYALVYGDEGGKKSAALGGLADKLKKALEKK
jgi:hypothetical protein